MGKEEVLQSKCSLWFWNNYHKHRRMLFHVDNNSFNRIIGANKKALGVVKGVADLILILPSHVVFIELKTETGTQSDAQIDFQKKVAERNHLYLVIRSFEEFQSFIWQVIGKC